MVYRCSRQGGLSQLGKRNEAVLGNLSQMLSGELFEERGLCLSGGIYETGVKGGRELGRVMREGGQGRRRAGGEEALASLEVL